MVMAADAEMYLKAEATYTDGEGSGKMEEVMTMMVGAEPVEPVEPVEPDAIVGDLDGDRNIDTGEMLAAIGQYFQDPPGLTLSQMLTLIGLYFGGSN